MEETAPVAGKRPKATFVAIDFETADREPESACAIALVRVEDYAIVERQCCLLRPPRKPLRNEFVFTYYHGITWAQVANAPTFGEAWPRLSQLLEGAEFLAAHNSQFDERVLRACCRAANLQPPGLPFVCTVELARRVWNIRPTKLPNVCQRLKIPLKHHEPLSDAEACGRIIIEAARACKQIAAPRKDPAS